MNLVVFNFEMNKNSHVLAFAIDWINEIAKHVNKLYVVSLRCGEFDVAKNVEVFCVNQNKKTRLNTIFSIWKILYKIHKQNKIDGYFVHMAHYFVPIIYPFAKLFRQKIVLWYAHTAVPFSLKIANFLIDIAVTSTENGYNIKSDKLKVLSQGINVEKLQLKNIKNIKAVATIGRITPIKNTKLIVEAFLKLDKKLYIIGDAIGKKDKEYLEEIKKIIPPNANNIIFLGVMKFDELLKFYQNIDLTINLGDGALDKVILESMACGIPVVTSNSSAKKIFPHLSNKGVYLIDKDQIFEVVKKIKLKDIDSKALREEVIKNHSLENLIKNIIKEFK